jgi:hypothetical protein
MAVIIRTGYYFKYARKRYAEGEILFLEVLPT